MALKTTTTHTCDRCGKQIAEYDGPPSETKSADEPSLSLRFQEKGKPEHRVGFDELCEKCVARLSQLVSMIALPEKKGEQGAA
jgi:hypothetical protein